jgi:D-alanyl-D-alanine carboxypeptidase (penicillin-binding protein 5/6)
MTIRRARPKIVIAVLPDMRSSACADKSFVANFPSMMWRKRFFFLCALVSVFALSAWSQDASDSQAVRPSGMSGPVRKAKAVTKDTDDADNESTPARKTKASKSTHSASHRKRAKAKETEEPIPAPTEYTPEGIPKTSAASVIVVDANSGRILYEKNADQTRAAASTQKLLTALIVAESGFLDRTVTVQPADTLAEPVKLNIKAGDTYQRIDLLRALLVKSPNDVARCLARDNAGSVEAFAEIMNRRAQELGAVHSHFVNPNGLPVPGQYSSARDLSLIARAAYANPTIRSIVCLPQLVFRYANGRTRELENTNKLLRRLPYCNGMKTGYTDAAGKCLIASGTRPGKDVIVVVLGDSSSHVWRDASALLSWSLWM